MYAASASRTYRWLLSSMQQIVALVWIGISFTGIYLSKISSAVGQSQDFWGPQLSQLCLRFRGFEWGASEIQI